MKAPAPAQAPEPAPAPAPDPAPAPARRRESLSHADLKERVKSGNLGGLDATKLEDLLEDDEFQKILGMDRAAFGKLPAWKRAKAKKAAGIY